MKRIIFAMIISAFFQEVKYNFRGYSSQGGEKRIKAGVKLAYKTDFIRFSTSGERTMLLVRHKPDKKMPPVNSNEQ